MEQFYQKPIVLFHGITFCTVAPLPSLFQLLFFRGNAWHLHEAGAWGPAPWRDPLKTSSRISAPAESEVVIF